MRAPGPNLFELDDWSVEFHAFEIIYTDPARQLSVTTEFSEDGKLVYLGEALKACSMSNESENLKIACRLKMACDSKGVAYEFVG